MVVYFSGTGNSRYAAQMFADRLGDKLVDLGAMIKAGNKADLYSERPWIFVSPAYAWQIPRFFANAILDRNFTGVKEAYFVMTCGSDIGNAGSKIARLCMKKGFVFRGVLQVVMPENYVAMYDVPDKQNSQRIIAASRPAIEGGIAAVQAGKPFPAGNIGMGDKIKTGVVNPLFYHFCVTAKPFSVTGSCISCGTCESACPLDNIRLVNGKPQWGEVCTHCMACICFCPESAIEYGQKSKGKPRYQCEEYKG